VIRPGCSQFTYWQNAWNDVPCLQEMQECMLCQILHVCVVRATQAIFQSSDWLIWCCALWRYVNSNLSLDQISYQMHWQTVCSKSIRHTLPWPTLSPPFTGAQCPDVDEDTQRGGRHSLQHGRQGWHREDARRSDLHTLFLSHNTEKSFNFAGKITCCWCFN